MNVTDDNTSILVAGGGIGGLAAALALAGKGYGVKVLEQAAHLGEIGAGIQLGPNAFAAFDALGVGPAMRASAVYTDALVMHDAVDASVVARVPVGAEFRARFGNPYAVIHRADLHQHLVDAALASERIEVLTDTALSHVEQNERGVVAYDHRGKVHRGSGLIGADGVKSVVRDQFVGDQARVSGHVVYRAVVERENFPEDLRWNAAAIWVGPHCHLVHYPLRGGEQFNVVVTFHSREQEQWGVTDGSEEEVRSYFGEIAPLPRALIELPRSWRRWATADRHPIATWSFGRVTLLGDSAHGMLQYLAQGACMALEDAVVLGEAMSARGGNLSQAFSLYEKSRVARTARVLLSSREMGRLYHAKGVERLVRNDLWKGRSAQRYYDALEWLYGWKVEACLA
ncbi:MAG: 2-polyprenyl-6-methoxyphenol hydroxylase-like FAD-dependent oxidoreductase [Gammaproteobacteria bacterium]|jgi:2-polyprenyl-6-methoxyphenol hydroxylase-like FAD-dependent oxidoreductase